MAIRHVFNSFSFIVIELESSQLYTVAEATPTQQSLVLSMLWKFSVSNARLFALFRLCYCKQELIIFIESTIVGCSVYHYCAARQYFLNFKTYISKQSRKPAVLKQVMSPQVKSDGSTTEPLDITDGPCTRARKQKCHDLPPNHTPLGLYHYNN